MIQTVHASRYRWGHVPTARLAHGEWQISRVYSVLGRAGPALPHAHRVAGICQDNSVGDWYLAFAYEAFGAQTVAGDADQARFHTDGALAAAHDIAERVRRRPGEVPQACHGFLRVRMTR